MRDDECRTYHRLTLGDSRLAPVRAAIAMARETGWDALKEEQAAYLGVDQAVTVISRSI